MKNIDKNKLIGNVVKISYGGDDFDYGYVERMVDTPMKDTYVVATEAYPIGRYYKKNFLEWTDDPKAIDFVYKNITPIYENNSWNHFIPDDIEPFSFFIEMAEIAPGVNEKNKQMKFPFHVCIYEGKEGAVPHIHIYYSHKGEDYDDHGKVAVSYICLGTNEYAPQHAKDTKKLNSGERKALIKFLSAPVDTFRKDNNGNFYRSTPWLEAIKHWSDFNKDWKKYFKFDDNGVPIMPDYSTINMPSKKDIEKYENQKFRI